MKQPHTISPTAVYDLEAARLALNFTRSTLNRERRLGRLRVAKRAGKYYLLGEWLLEWIRTGEVRVLAQEQSDCPIAMSRIKSG
jgi:hypothetical protein